MVTLKWFVRLFFWLFITMKDISGESDLSPHYAIKVSFFAAIGTSAIIMGVLTTLAWWDPEMTTNYLLMGFWSAVYLLTGLTFFFSEPSGNCNPVWQTNGPW